MSKKKKQSPAKTKLDSTMLQKQASDLLDAGFYKEAIEVYKKLLKQEQRQEWQVNLATAYLERAKALAAKGMYKEAVVFWENRDNLCDDKVCFADYIEWLALAGRHLKALRLFVNQSIAEEQNQRLSALFAALLLVGDVKLTTALPPESTLYQHYLIIKQALQAYYQSHDEDVKACLKKIPFRSPYRDFSTILRTLILLETDPQSAFDLVEQIPIQSPFKDFAKLLEMSLLPNDEVLIKKMNSLTGSEQSLIASLKGWDKDQTKIIASLQIATKKERSTRALFNVVITNQTFFGTDYSRRFCLASLPDYPDGMTRYEKAFGNLSIFEQARITALGYEQRGKIEESDRAWQKCIEILKRHADQKDNTLKAALIFRHLAEAWITHSNDSRIATQYLAESLRLDPNDKASYLRLLELRDEMQDLILYRPWIMAGVERFPEDRELLLAAIAVKKEEEDFTSAIHFAEALIKADPISVKAKQILLSCYIVYIRDLVQNAEYEKVDTLFTQIERLYPDNGIITINQGLLALKKGQEQKAKASLIKGVKQSGDNICGQFRLMAEVMLMQYSWETVSSLVPLPTRRHSYTPTQSEIIALIKVVTDYYEEYPSIFKEALIEPLHRPLKKACPLHFSMDERMDICHFLSKIENYKLLKEYAEIGIAQWADYHPAFTYFQIYAETKGQSNELSFQQVNLLEEAMDMADIHRDKRTSTLIINFLHQELMESTPPELPPEIERALLELREEILADADNEIFDLPPPL